MCTIKLSTLIIILISVPSIIIIYKLLNILSKFFTNKSYKYIYSVYYKDYLYSYNNISFKKKITDVSELKYELSKIQNLSSNNKLDLKKNLIFRKGLIPNMSFFLSVLALLTTISIYIFSQINISPSAIPNLENNILTLDMKISDIRSQGVNQNEDIKKYTAQINNIQLQINNIQKQTKRYYNFIFSSMMVLTIMLLIYIVKHSIYTFEKNFIDYIFFLLDTKTEDTSNNFIITPHTNIILTPHSILKWLKFK